MVLAERKMNDIVNDLLKTGAGLIIGWLVSSFYKVGKPELMKVSERLEKVEKDLSQKMTRVEFDTAFNEIKTMLKENRTEMRADFRELKEELKTKT